jgi:hypothetical protein
MFACPRDSGANALQLRFREGASSRIERGANHAFTEYRSISPAPCRVQALRDGYPRPAPPDLFSAGSCNAPAAPHFIAAALADGRSSVLLQREKTTQ